MICGQEPEPQQTLTVYLNCFRSRLASPPMVLLSILVGFVSLTLFPGGLECLVVCLDSVACYNFLLKQSISVYPWNCVWTLNPAWVPECWDYIWQDGCAFKSFVSKVSSLRWDLIPLKFNFRQNENTIRKSFIPTLLSENAMERGEQWATVYQ